jgi:UDP-N-acetylmuramyl pentapeptide phosphotransferase/UDP-N-acetylglucosamine-1-phosphate transferase
MFLLLALVTFGLAAWLTSRFCRPESRLHILDHPNERSLHTNPTPRTGGIAIVSAVLISGAIAVSFFGHDYARLTWLAAAVLIVASVSFVDDRLRLAPGMRLGAHIVAAIVIVIGGFVLRDAALPGWAWPLPAVIAVPITLLYVVWMLNLYNFMDGMDGFAGGMAVCGFGTFAVLGWMSGAELFAVLNLIVAAGALGFLLFNFPPARIFMGDVGSSTLGLLAGAFSLWGAEQGVFPFWVAALVFSPFIVDATVTLGRRLLRRERVWEAHKTHYYQRLVQLGWGHRKTVLWEYGLMALCGFSAVLASRLPAIGQWLTILGWVTVYLLLMVLTSVMESRQQAVERP